MKTSTVSLIKLEPSNGMYLKNKITDEVYEGFIYLAKSLSVNDFEEITAEEYQQILADREVQDLEMAYEESENVNATLQTTQIDRLQSLDNFQINQFEDFSQEDDIMENSEILTTASNKEEFR